MAKYTVNENRSLEELNNATTSQDGLMASADKTKLNGVAANADDVSFTQTLTSGTELGKISINGVSKSIYAPKIPFELAVDKDGIPGYIYSNKFFYFTTKVVQNHTMDVYGYNYDYSTGAPPLKIDGTTVANSLGRGLTLIVIRLSDFEIVFKQAYDTYGNINYCNTLSNKIKEYDNRYLIVIFSQDAIGVNSTLNSTINQYGGNASYTVNGSRVSWYFVGRKGMVPGTAKYGYGSGVRSWSGTVYYNNGTEEFSLS